MIRRAILWTLAAFLAGAMPAPASAQEVLQARVLWSQGDRVYVAANDSLWLGAGTVLRLRDRDREIATAEVVAVHDAVLIVATITSGSLKGVKRLERLEVHSERNVVRPMPVLRVGYPSPKRIQPFFECRQLVLNAAGFRADTLGERSFRLVRDSTWVPPRPEPDMLQVRLFDDAADEEIALERGDLDVAIFWPGEASPHIRQAMKWEGRPIELRTRGIVGYRIESDSVADAVATRSTADVKAGGALTSEPLPNVFDFLFGRELGVLASMNREVFRGDLSGPYGGGTQVIPEPEPGTIHVDPACPGHATIERFLNENLKAKKDATRRVHLSYLDSPAENERGQGTSGWLFGIGCPVLSRPEMRPYLELIDVSSLVNLFDCRTAGRSP